MSAEEFKELFDRQLRTIEELARRLFEHKYDSAQGLWTIQTDLVRYQIEVRGDVRKELSRKSETQATIAEVAAQRRGDWKKELQRLQGEISHSEMRVTILEHALNLSMQFGDALAWIFLKGDVRRIASLAINKPNPPIPEGLSLQAMLGVAESLANRGAGFPLIHDVTRCLRVGDLTFCNILDDDDEPLTVEVKSKTASIEGNIATLDVAIYAPAVQPKFTKIFEKLSGAPVQVEETARPPAAEETPRGAVLGSGPRLERQVERMARSRRLQAASHLETIDQAGNNILAAMTLQMKGVYFYWDIIAELATEAKSRGYATRAVDDAFFYTATYSEDKSVYPWSESADLPFAAQVSERVKEAFPLYGDASRDHICFRSSWDYLSGEVPPYIRPVLLYNLPIDQRIDIMWRRLSIVVYMNIGKMVEALKLAGIEARVPADEDELNHQFIPITFSETLDDGSIVKVGGGDLNEFANKVGLEFMSLEGFVSCALQTMTGAVELAKSKVRSTSQSGFARPPS